MKWKWEMAYEVDEDLSSVVIQLCWEVSSECIQLHTETKSASTHGQQMMCNTEDINLCNMQQAA